MTAVIAAAVPGFIPVLLRFDPWIERYVWEMDEEVRISEEEYRSLEEDAARELETLRAESVENLRNKAIDELNTIILALNKNITRAANSLKNMKDAIENDPIENPYENAGLKFWLTQIVNFIAVALFKVPRELTPSVGYPFGSRRLAREFEEHVRETDKRFIDTFTWMVDFPTKLHESFCTIRENISTDDVKLVIFCNACRGKELRPYLDINHKYRPLTLFLYNNGVSFQSKLFKTNAIDCETIEAVSAMEKRIKEQYNEAFMADRRAGPHN